MKDFKKIFRLILIGCAIIILSACTTTHKQYLIFAVNTGDLIKVEIMKSKGYKVQDNKASRSFNVTKDGDVIFEQAGFNPIDVYDRHKTSLRAADGTKVNILDSGEKDGNKYIFYSLDDGSKMEYLYIVSIIGSNTSVMLMSTVSENAARECFNALTLSLEQ